MNEFELNLFKRCYPYLKILQITESRISDGAKLRLKKLIKEIEPIVYPEQYKAEGK